MTGRQDKREGRGAGIWGGGNGSSEADEYNVRRYLGGGKGAALGIWQAW